MISGQIVTLRPSSISVVTPATSANLGPGFDCLGLALQLYNRLTAIVQPAGLIIEVSGEGADSIPGDASNLVYCAMARLFAQVGAPLPGLRLQQSNAIPISSGLGSSSAAIVSGLTAANALLDYPLRPDALLKLANELEGHPDNVAPALLGGLTAAWPVDGDVWVTRYPAAEMTALVVKPGYPWLTHTARAVLPKSVPFGEAVGNIGRIPLLLDALQRADYDRLPRLMEDNLHQPYRLPAMPGVAAAYQAARALGAAVALSGAGPSLLALAPANHAAIAAAMQTAFTQAGVTSRVWLLAIDRVGTQVVLGDGGALATEKSA